jgi:hypothetical protein
MSRAEADVSDRQRAYLLAELYDAQVQATYNQDHPIPHQDASTQLDSTVSLLNPL